MFGIDPVSGSHRPPCRLRGARRARAARERRGRRVALRARHRRQGARVRRERRARASAERPAAARRAVERRRACLRRTRKTSSGRSPPTAGCGCCSPARSRPRSAACPEGRSTGPGPVAETFPEPLTELEHDLWVPPLRDAVREAVLLAGRATPAEVDASDIIVAVDGHVAIDLRLAGEIKPKRRLVRTAQPDPGRAPAARCLAGRAGSGPRCRASPSTCSTGSTPTSRRCPRSRELTSRQLIALLHRSHAVLRALHAHEILMGMLTDTGRNRMTGASVALRVLVEARQDGLTDEEILARSPVVLALTAPRVAPAPELPAGGASAIHLGRDDDSGNDNGILREALRLRVRWIQELSGPGRVGARRAPHRVGDLTEPELIRHMTLDHVEAVATKRAVVDPRARRRPTTTTSARRCRPGSRCPTRARPIRVAERGAKSAAAPAPAAASARGPVTYDTENPPTGSVLVTTTLHAGSRAAAARGSTASWPRPARCCRTSRSSPARRGVATVVGYASAVRRPARGRDRARRRRDRPGHACDERGGDSMKIIAWLAGIGTLLAGALLHDRVAQPLGVEPGAVLRSHRPHRRGRPGDRARAPHARAPRARASRLDPEVARHPPRHPAARRRTASPG